MIYKDYYSELRASFQNPYLWAYMGWNDIKQRYRRSVLGTIWVVLTTAIFVGTIAFLWSTLFKTSLNEYLLFFCAGHIVWQLISLQITESANGFDQFEYIINQTRLPFPALILRLVVRNSIVFAHNLVILVIVMLIFGNASFLDILSSLCGMALLLTTLFFLSIITSLACTRYKDMKMIVQNLLMIIFYVSPIMWQPHLLPDHYQWVVKYNPIAVFIGLIRAPLIGESVTAKAWITGICITLVLAALSHYLMERVRNKIAFWI